MKPRQGVLILVYNMILVHCGVRIQAENCGEHFYKGLTAAVKAAWSKPLMSAVSCKAIIIIWRGQLSANDELLGLER